MIFYSVSVLPADHGRKTSPRLSVLSFPGRTHPPPPRRRSKREQRLGALSSWLRKAHYLRLSRWIHFISARSSLYQLSQLISSNWISPGPLLIADKLDVTAVSFKQISLTCSRNLLCPCRSGRRWLAGRGWGVNNSSNPRRLTFEEAIFPSLHI